MLDDMISLNAVLELISDKVWQSDPQYDGKFGQHRMPSFEERSRVVADLAPYTSFDGKTLELFHGDGLLQEIPFFNYLLVEDYEFEKLVEDGSWELRSAVGAVHGFWSMKDLNVYVVENQMEWPFSLYVRLENYYQEVFWRMIHQKGTGEKTYIDDYHFHMWQKRETGLFPADRCYLKIDGLCELESERGIICRLIASMTELFLDIIGRAITLKEWEIQEERGVARFDGNEYTFRIDVRDDIFFDLLDAGGYRFCLEKGSFFDEVDASCKSCGEYETCVAEHEYEVRRRQENFLKAIKEYPETITLI